LRYGIRGTQRVCNALIYLDQRPFLAPQGARAHRRARARRRGLAKRTHPVSSCCSYRMTSIPLRRMTFNSTSAGPVGRFSSRSSFDTWSGVVFGAEAAQGVPRCSDVSQGWLLALPPTLTRPHVVYNPALRAGSPAPPAGRTKGMAKKEISGALCGDRPDRRRGPTSPCP
jgi:hypothetical protein